MYRPDHNEQKRAFISNKKKVYATQKFCGICGQPVDFSLKFPHPLSPCIDHIIPIAKGGHPTDLQNLQLAHLTCNRAKSDKMIAIKNGEQKTISNRELPLSIDWENYKAE